MMDPVEDLYISPNKKIYSHTEMTQIPIIREREREREREIKIYDLCMAINLIPCLLNNSCL